MSISPPVSDCCWSIVAVDPVPPVVFEPLLLIEAAVSVRIFSLQTRELCLGITLIHGTYTELQDGELSKECYFSTIESNFLRENG